LARRKGGWATFTAKRTEKKNRMISGNNPLKSRRRKHCVVETGRNEVDIKKGVEIQSKNTDSGETGKF